jgi:ubiquinone/menaquinone biosynthesis C-methylase UbiE
MEFYKTMAKDFSRTRYKIWPGVREFLESIPINSLILDAGCGNGKNMMETKHNFIGLDTCSEFLDIIQTKIQSKHQTNIQDLIHGSIEKLPFESNTFDALISIAVIHHLQTKQQRFEALKELIRVVKPKGSLLITVWQLESNPTYTDGLVVPNSLDQNDRLIKWSVHGSYLYRFYHFYTLNEIQDLIRDLNQFFQYKIKNIHLSDEKLNYYIKIQL